MIRSKPFRNPLCVALDVSSEGEAMALVDQLADIVGGFKLGPRLLMKSPGLLRKISERAPTFVDCKFFDIPTVMEAAVQSCFDEGASIVTVHGMAGKEALELLAAQELRLNKLRSFRLLAVTILTSWSESSYPPVLLPGAPAEHVQSLAAFARDCGVQGLVCSAQELKHLSGKGHYLVTPGIRRTSDNIGDQKRVMGPKEAIQAGSNLIVVGRPIIEGQNPRVEAQAILEELG